MVRQERTASVATRMAGKTPHGAKPNRVAFEGGPSEATG